MLNNHELGLLFSWICKFGDSNPFYSFLSTIDNFRVLPHVPKNLFSTRLVGIKNFLIFSRTDYLTKSDTFFNSVRSM